MIKWSSSFIFSSFAFWRNSYYWTKLHDCRHPSTKHMQIQQTQGRTTWYCHVSHTSSACFLNCNMKLKRLKCINESCFRPRSGLCVKMPWVWYFKTLNLSRFSTSTIFLTMWSPEQNITRILINPQWMVDKSSSFAKKLQKKFKLVLSYKTMLFLKNCWMKIWCGL